MRHSISFSLIPSDAATGRPIRMRVSYNSTRVDIRTGCSCPEERWKDGRVTGSKMLPTRQQPSEVNARLSSMVTAVDELFTWLDLLEHRAPTADEIRAACGIKQKQQAHGAFELIDEFISSSAELNDWQESTRKKWHTIRQHLYSWRKELSVQGLSDGTLNGFVGYMHEIGLRNTTISKYCRNIKWLLRWCVRHNRIPQEALSAFDPKIKGTDASLKELVYLEWEELLTVMNCEVPSYMTGVAATRDTFVLSCFTGLRYSDVQRLKRTDVFDDHIRIVTKKDKEGLRIELNQFSRAILAKHSDVDFPRGAALPVVSNQKANEHLKELGRLAGLNRQIKLTWYTGAQRHEELRPLWTQLTTHAARRTFVIVALRLGIPAEVIMSWTGHSSMQAMQPYYKIVDAAKASAMSRFDTLNGSTTDPIPDPKKL